MYKFGGMFYTISTDVRRCALEMHKLQAVINKKGRLLIWLDGL